MGSVSQHQSNARNSLTVVQGAKAMTKTISSTPIVAATDSAFIGANGLHPNTQIVRLQIYSNDIYMSVHGETPPSTANAVQLVAGTILEMSKSEWISAIFVRVSADATLTVQQLRGT
jgi:hypothetical protein